MNLKTVFLICISCPALLMSCIKSEGLDREADIESFLIEDNNLLTTVYDEYRKKISVVLRDTAGYRYKTITPIITTSKGAKVEPASGQKVTLNNYQHFFTVTAEDGGEKTYEVVIEPLDQLGQDFEQWDVANQGTNNEYYTPSSYMWVNANEGVRIVWNRKEEFPTSRSEEVRPGSTGKYSAKLSTKEGNTNTVSDQMDLPVLAGNMFRGEFVIGMALKDPLKTTNFGQPYPDFLGQPLELKAWYKYKRGDSGFLTYKYNDKGKKERYIDETLEDYPEIYAILYKVPKGMEGVKTFLTASDIKTSDRIVAKALMNHDDVKENEWVHFSSKFVYSEEMDYTQYDYKLTVVLSSSFDGAYYRGKIGSELLVDDLEIITDDADI